MVSQSERRALILVTSLLCLGVAARVGRATRSRPQPTSAERAALDAQIARVESARVSGRAKADRRTGQGRKPSSSQSNPAAERRHRAPGTPEKRDADRVIDLDVATASEIERLPYIGRVLAERIVADRDTCGAFGSLDALTRVRGVGPALARRLEPLVTFSERSRPMGAVRPPRCARADSRAALRRRGRP